jgi:NADH:ubiquinone oxidoreductase subunit 4 (subunit M)
MTEGLPIVAGAGLGEWSTLMVVMTIIATTGVILGAIYMLSLARRVFFGAITHDENREVEDLTARELCVLVPLVVLIFVFGFFPNLLLDSMHASVGKLVAETRPIVSQVRAPASSAQAQAQANESELRVALRREATP